MNLQKAIICFVSFWLSICHISAQQLSGKIVSREGNIIPYANVFLLSHQDSSFVRGTVSNENGQFLLPSYTHNDILKVSAIGYSVGYFTCKGDSLGNLELKDNAKQLNEVVVKGHRNYVKTTNMGITISMTDNPLSKLGTALDAIKQMPLIDAVGNDISVLGKGTPVFYIDNRKVRDNNELSQLSSQNIKNVEIITSPGAKYEADVKSVIIIHTKKKELGWAGIARVSGVFSEMSHGMADLDFSYNSDKGLGFYANGDYEGDGFKQKGYILEQFNSDLNTTKTNGKFKRCSQNIKLAVGSSYDFNDNSLGIRYEFRRTPSDKYDTRNIIETNVTSVSQNLSSTSEKFSQSSRHSLNSYAVFKFGRMKNYEFTTDVDYVYNLSSNSSNVEELGNSYENKIATANSAKNNIVAAKANLSARWKYVSLNLGGQYSFTRTQQTFGANVAEAKDFFEDSSDEERQHLSAGYIAANWKIGKKWSSRTELRVEYTDFTYLENGKIVPEQTKGFSDWLPYISINYQDGDYGFGLSYNTVVVRPSYKMLANSYTYSSHTLWFMGNPLLKSELDRNLELSFNYHQTSLAFTYVHCMRELASAYFYLADKQMNIYKVINLPNYNYFQITLGQRFNIGNWHPSLYGLLKVQNLKYGEPKNSYDTPRFRIIVRNRFDLPWKIYGYFDGMWIGRGNSSTNYTKNRVILDMGLNKSIGSWAFTIYWNDCFKLWHQANLVETNGVSYYQNLKGASHNVFVSATYTFNKKKNYKGKGAAQSEVNRL